MSPKFLHDMGLASIVAGFTFLVLAYFWRRMGS